MSRRILPKPTKALYLLLAVLLVFPCLARADEKDDLIEALRQVKKELQILVDSQQKFLEKQVAQAERAERESKLKEELAKKQEARIATLEKQLAALREQLTAAKLEARSLMARAEQVLVQLEEAQKELAKLKEADKKPERRPLNLPAELVEGAVSKIDEKSGLISISVGSDSGLQVGHTLEVFRLDPKPRFVGTVEIIRVTPTESVGRLTRTLPGTKVQVGDRATSRIFK